MAGVFARIARSAGARTIALVAAAALALSGVGAVATLTAEPAAAAPTPQSDPSGCGYGTGGPDATTLCWIDMADYDDAVARSTAGQDMSVDLPGGYTATFTVISRPTGSSPTRTVTPTGFPTWGGAYLGNVGYTGTPGAPALYTDTGDPSETDFSTTLTLRNISVKDSSGNAVTGFAFVGADAESSNQGESITFTSDKTLDVIAAPSPSASAGGCQNNVTGAGTMTVTCTGAAGDNPTGTVLVRADAPTTFSQTMFDSGYGGRQAVAFAIQTAHLTLKKDVSARVAPTDSFDVTVTSPEGTTVGSVTTGTADTASTGSLTVLTRPGAGSYTLSESATPGSGTDLSYYTSSWSCTNAAVGDTTTLPSGKGTSVEISPVAGDDITCTVTNTPPEAWTCSAYGYLFQGDENGYSVSSVDLVTGESQVVIPSVGLVNAVGYNTTDNYMYGWAGDAGGDLVRIAADGGFTSLGDPTPSSKPGGRFNVAAFDGAGHLYVTLQGQVPLTWYEIDLAYGSSTYGQVVDQGTFSTPAGFYAGADWSWSGGSLYMLDMPRASGDLEPHLVKFTPGDAAGEDLGGIGKTVASRSIFGASYSDAAGKLYFSHNSDGQIYRVDPSNPGNAILAATGPAASGNDGARCSAAVIPTITVTKQVDGRAASADQFTVGIEKSDGTVLDSATTSGTQTTASTSDWPVSQGTTYTITDALANGSPSASDPTIYGQVIACTDEQGDPVSTGGTAGAWTLTVTEATYYTCVVTNTSLAASVTVTKVWSVTDGGTTTDYTLPGDEADLPQGLTASPTVNGATVAWGTAVTGLHKDDTVTIGESGASADPELLPGCTLESSTLTEGGSGTTLPQDATLEAGTNDFTITNAVTCTQTLSLVKKVAHGSAPTTAWTLSATAPGASDPTVTGNYSATTPVSGAVETGVDYALAEAGGPAEYEAAGPWTCADSRGGSVTVGNASVSVPLGQDVTCTITNTTATLTILKHVDSGTIAPDDFTLAATPQAGPPGLGAQTVPGADIADDPNAALSNLPAASTIEVLPGQDYTLTESADRGDESYLGLGLQRWNGTAWVDVASDTVSVAAGTHVVYRLVNSSVPALALPITGGVGTLVFAATGGALILLALVGGGWAWRRRRRRA